ncbi:type IV conjugative transfer system lipoprotein TraV [Methylomonas sp. AM2-LC]|uniref:type IV conjugative transfer system lipoprotein TraV n=1 Tax=Methylomonas sp. AM2-LC TaxID=3153301 RepID=UPI0032666CC0
MVVKSLLILFLTITISGCSWMGIGASEFSCPGGVDGVRCLSARQVYQATESSDYVKMNADPDNSDSKKSNPSIVSGQQLQSNSQVAVPTIEQPIPIRTQAKVMRIWVAPWEDDVGDLHADGFMYTEIESRRWNLGDRFKSPSAALSPLSERTPSEQVYSETSSRNR